jgi:hypothetical protein
MKTKIKEEGRGGRKREGGKGGLKEGKKGRKEVTVRKEGRKEGHRAAATHLSIFGHGEAIGDGLN